MSGRKEAPMETQGKAMLVDYTTVFRNVPLAICISDQQAVEICNPAATHLFGHPAQTLVGMPISMLWPAQDSRSWAPEKIFDQIADRGCYTDVRIVRHADAELFWCRINAARYDGTENALRYIWTFVKIEPTVRLGNVLSPRERQIAAALVVGKTSRAIAQDVGLSTRTLEYYRERLMRRLGVANCKELICRLTIGTSA
jgi:PAS domain S-box-containing protein